MRELRYTLLSEGSSDEALIPILTWMLRLYLVDTAIQAQWADLRLLRQPVRNLPNRIVWSLDLYPCDLLFVHRDANGESYDVRLGEIRQAEEDARVLEKESHEIEAFPPVIGIVPVRMQEAWLLTDEAAIRWASGNPNGQQVLQIPRVNRLEQLSNPKSRLYELIREASGLKGRRLKKLSVSQAVRRVADFTDDFSALRNLAAFYALESEVVTVLAEQGWIDI